MAIKKSWSLRLSFGLITKTYFNRSLGNLANRNFLFSRLFSGQRPKATPTVDPSASPDPTGLL